MSTPSLADLRGWTAALTPDPLDPGDPRYVVLREAGRAAVDELMATIELSLDTTTQLLSGPNGSGKTTELRRLGAQLTHSKHQVVILDVTRYISESAPVDITEFLIALAVGTHDAVAPDEGPEAGFGRRLVELLGRLRIDVTFASMSASASAEGFEVAPAGARVAVGLREIKSSQPLVAELRSKLSYHLGELYGEVARFLQELLAGAAAPSGTVLIVDGLDKLRGTTETDADVQQSIEALFVNHAGKLRFASHHGVYVVPTYLQFSAPGSLPHDSRVLPVPVPHVFPRGTGDAENVANTRSQLGDVIARRLPVDMVFMSQSQVDMVVDASGGHLRDLFVLLRQLTNLVYRTRSSLPVSDEQVAEAISYVAHDFATMTAEQESFLRRVAAAEGMMRPAADEVALMARLLQSHMLLGHLNGEDWYEVHPLARRALELS